MVLLFALSFDVAPYRVIVRDTTVQANGLDDMFTTIAKPLVRVHAERAASKGDPSILLGFVHEGSNGDQRACAGGGCTIQ